MSRMLPLLAIVLALCVFAPSRSRAESPVPVVKGIRVFTAGESVGVEITADKDLVYTCTKIPPLRKIIVDLPRTEPGRPDSEYPVDSTMITDIRLTRIFINDDLFARIVINLKEDADYTAGLNPADRKKLTVFLRKPSTAAPSAVSVAAAERSVTKQPSAAEQIQPTPAAAALPAMKPLETTPLSPVTISSVRISTEAIDILLEGTTGGLKSFTLSDPGRLVIDIPAAQSTLTVINVPAVNRFGIVQARIGTFEGKLRLVFDTGKHPFPDYRIVRNGTGLRVLPGGRE